MQPAEYHPLLHEQFETFIGPSAQLSDAEKTLLQAISQSYTDFEATIAHRTDQLIASTSQAYSFLDSIHKGFIMCDTSGEVVLVNNALRDITLLQTDRSLTADMLETLFGPELGLKALIAHCIATSQPAEREAVNFGKRVLHVSLAPLLNGNQLFGVVILVEDVTEQKVLERSKDEFLSIASHELRTPLTAIRGNASLITKHYAASITDPDMAEMIADIHESSVRLIGIVNDFLDVAAIEQGKISMNPESFSLKPVVDEVCRELEQLCADKGIGLVCDSSVEQAPAVNADRQRIKQVIINLVGNATKFTDEGSIAIAATSDEQFVHITVTDTGKGMSPENQKLLFRKFQQAGTSLLTRDTTKGTGLGLYISKLIIELSGGTIGLERSEPNGGSTFGFTLPRNIS
jgi:two-component system sensor histidine kinase ResE